jgi:hypothetical protein
VSDTARRNSISAARILKSVYRGTSLAARGRERESSVRYRDALAISNFRASRKAVGTRATTVVRNLRKAGGVREHGLIGAIQPAIAKS